MPWKPVVPAEYDLRKDGLHMTRAGYAIWVKAMKPILADYGFQTR